MDDEIITFGEIITPKMAKDLLKHNINNRVTSETHVAFLADMMKRGQWKKHAQSVQFTGTPEDPKRCIDGQHRLKAIIKANVPIYLTLAFNVPEDAADTIDNGKRRTNGDHVLFGVPGLKPAAAREIGVVTPWLILYERATITQWTQTNHQFYKSTSSTDVVAYVKKNKKELTEAYAWVEKNCCFNRKTIRPRSEMLLIRILTHRVDPIASEDFCLKIYAGINLMPNTVEMTLRTWLLDMALKKEVNTKSIQCIRYTLAQAWNKIRTGNNRITTMRTLLYKEGTPAQRFK